MSNNKPLKPVLNRALLLVSALCLCVITACSIGAAKPRPHLAATVASVAANYLGHVATGQTRHLNTLVMWNAYLTESKPGLTQKQYLEELRSISSRWDPQEHPLLGLNITEIETEDDEAEIRFQKPGGEADEIRVNLRWSGSGWMVVDDSLFGEGGQIRSWVQGS